MDDRLWEKAKAFHGHECPGLAIGVRASEAAIAKLGIDPAADEELVCVTENDACGVDAVQAILCCTVGKGNLIFKNTGKQAFSFYDRKTGNALRAYLKAKHNGMEREAYKNYLLSAPLEELFDFSAPADLPPEKARIFASVACNVCGEAASEHKMRIQDGKPVCLSCFAGDTRGRLK